MKRFESLESRRLLSVSHGNDDKPDQNANEDRNEAEIASEKLAIEASVEATKKDNSKKPTSPPGKPTPDEPTDSKEESTTFFSYRSKDMQKKDADQYNAFAAEVGPNPSSHVQYSLPNGFAFWHNVRHQMPSMERNGVLNFQRVAGDLDKHTMIRGYDWNKTDAYDFPDCNNRTTLQLHELYEFEFDFSIEDNGTEWWNSVRWMIFFQLWGWFDADSTGYADAPTNPVLALSIDADAPGTQGPQLKIEQRGSGELYHSGYETNIQKYFPIDGVGDYHIKVQYRADYEQAGNGLSRVWLNGKEIWHWEGQSAYKSNCLGSPTGPVPYFGAYTYDEIPGNGVEVQFDNIEQRMFTSIEAVAFSLAEAVEKDDDKAITPTVDGDQKIQELSGVAPNGELFKQ